MAEGNNFKHTPDRFSRGHSEPRKINNFNYTGGVWNKPMPYNSSCALGLDGRTDHPTNNLGEVKNTYFSGWLYYIPSRLPDGVLGKQFQLDFAWYAGPTYYDGTGNPTLHIDIQFYNMITGRWSGWARLSGTYAAPPTYGISTGSLGYGSVDNTLFARGNRGDSYSPLCGFNGHLASRIISAISGRSFSSYGSMFSYLKGCGLNPSSWDGSHVSFLAAPPVGVRYMSLNGKWDNGGYFVSSASCGVYRNNARPGAKTALDGGHNTGGVPLLSFYVDENFIRNVCGTTVGITKFKLRFWKSDNSYWDWPHDNDSQWQALDNPRVGLLDWGAKGSPWDWPPRYDAKAWYRNRTADTSKEYTKVHYCPAGSSNWQIN